MSSDKQVIEILKVLETIVCRLSFITKHAAFFIVLPPGWYSYRPSDSCKHIQASGYSKGDGEYWIDPEKNGNPLRVYCDMTTDGGK